MLHCTVPLQIIIFFWSVSSLSNQLLTISERTEPCDSSDSASNKAKPLPNPSAADDLEPVRPNAAKAVPKLCFQTMPSINIRTPLTKQQLPFIAIHPDESVTRKEQRTTTRNAGYEVVKHVESCGPESSMVSPEPATKEAMVQFSRQEIGK